MGQCPVKKYNEQLLHLIEAGRIDATKIISHQMKLNEAPKGYEMFDKKEDVTKIVLKPQMRVNILHPLFPVVLFLFFYCSKEIAKFIILY